MFCPHPPGSHSALLTMGAAQSECCKGLCPQTTPEADCHISQGPDRITDGMLNLDDLEEDKVFIKW